MNFILEIIVFILAIPVYIVECIIITCTPRSWRAKQVSGETVLITGAGSGIGRLMALRFANLGCKIVLLDVSKQGNDRTAQMIQKSGGTAYSYVCDLCNKEDVYKTAKRIKDDVGVVTILINNAGIVSGKPFLETSDSMIQKTFDVNIMSHFWTVKSFLPDMIKNKNGHIVTIASLAGISGSSYLVDYCASKFAAVGFDESLTLELAAQGHDEYIKTTVILPFYISTGMFDGVQSSLIPLLTPEQAVNDIMASVLANERVVKLPWMMNILTTFARIMPWKARTHSLRVFGDINSAMKTFKGRN